MPCKFIIQEDMPKDNLLPAIYFSCMQNVNFIDLFVCSTNPKSYEYSKILFCKYIETIIAIVIPIYIRRKLFWIFITIWIAYK